MKSVLFAAVAAVGLGLFAVPDVADAHYKTRAVSTWDPTTGQYITTNQQSWVPDHHLRHHHRLHHVTHARHQVHNHHTAHVHAAHVHAAHVHTAHAAHAGGGHRR